MWKLERQAGEDARIVQQPRLDAPFHANAIERPCDRPTPFGSIAAMTGLEARCRGVTFVKRPAT